MITLEDVLIAARTVYGEARNQSLVGKKAVVHVLVNRVNKKLMDADHTIAATCLRRAQFSCWNEDDPNRLILLTADLDDKVFRNCMKCALEAIDEEDFTSGATHYHTKSVLPKWAVGHKPCFTEGDHLFYNDVA